MTRFDRTAEDVGNVLSLEHVNLTVPDQSLAALFYVTGMGFTRDPYMDFGLANMWVNAGAQQFHLPLGAPQVFRGTITVAVPDLDMLERRLGRIARHLDGTKFTLERDDTGLRVVCPWGNRIRARGPGAFGTMSLGIPRLEVTVAPGHAAGIGRFYRQVMRCPVTEADATAEVRVGVGQHLAFTETETPDALPDYDGHHVAVYLADFSGPHRWLAERGLITEESDRHQYRFQSIVDPDSGAVLTELEHEVRSMTHPMYQRPLVNRNPALRVGSYRPGTETFTPPDPTTETE